ncbi:MAG: YhbY family RNA-binding protein [Bacillales bacterium]
MLNKEQIQILKQYAQKEDVIKINVGKNYLSETVQNNINSTLKSKELIKIHFLKTIFNKEEVDNMINDVLKYSQSEIVFHIGHTYLLYKKNIKINKFKF